VAARGTAGSGRSLLPTMPLPGCGSINAAYYLQGPRRNCVNALASTPTPLARSTQPSFAAPMAWEWVPESGTFSVVAICFALICAGAVVFGCGLLYSWWVDASILRSEAEIAISNAQSRRRIDRRGLLTVSWHTRHALPAPPPFSPTLTNPGRRRAHRAPAT
jgi:hypothetical protein